MREVSANSVEVLLKKAPFLLNHLLICRLELSREVVRRSWISFICSDYNYSEEVVRGSWISFLCARLELQRGSFRRSWSCLAPCFMLFLKRIMGSSLMKLSFTMGNRTPLRMTVLQQFIDKFADKARKLGIGPLFSKILPFLIQPTLEDEERHLLMKVIDRVLHKLDE